MNLHFSDYFGVSSKVLDSYGAFDISVVSDLPMFIDPFLLFNSERADYQDLHRGILRYLIFLRDIAGDDLDQATIDNLYRFKEVKQNWLGFTVLGNSGSGLGKKFAESLHSSLNTILHGFGNETVTKSSHLEKLCLIQPGVGRDSISDFATNLIKDYLCQYTETFATSEIDPKHCARFAVPRARFNFETESWETREYLLPSLGRDFVLLTPVDILTRDETWINHSNMIGNLTRIAPSVPDSQLRAQVDRYFRQQLSRNPSREERLRASEATFKRFPELIDYYIRHKEDTGDRAVNVSSRRVEKTDAVFVRQLKRLVEDLRRETDFYAEPLTSYEEALARAKHFKHYVENQDGYKLINNAGRPFSSEKEVQLFFGLVWFGSEFDVNREPDNGRGPVDYKVSKGAPDKALIEFKLGSNSHLKRNLEKQLPVYEAANQTSSSLKVIVCYTASDQARVSKILRELKLLGEESIIVIDARRDNKPSASKA